MINEIIVVCYWSQKDGQSLTLIDHPNSSSAICESLSIYIDRWAHKAFQKIRKKGDHVWVLELEPVRATPGYTIYKPGVYRGRKYLCKERHAAGPDFNLEAIVGVDNDYFGIENILKY